MEVYAELALQMKSEKPSLLELIITGILLIPYICSCVRFMDVVLHLKESTYLECSSRSIEVLGGLRFVTQFD